MALNQNPKVSGIVENKLAYCSSSNCDLLCFGNTIRNKQPNFYVEVPELNTTLMGTVRMSGWNKNDTNIREALKYVASIHARLSKRFGSDKRDENQMDWEYTIIKDNDGLTKIMCKISSDKSNFNQPVEVYATESEERIIQIMKAPQPAQNLSYIFSKCESPSKRSSSNICMECKNSTKDEPQNKKMPNNLNDICSKCNFQNLSDDIVNEFTSYHKYLNKIKTDYYNTQNSPPTTNLTPFDAAKYGCSECHPFQYSAERESTKKCNSTKAHGYEATLDGDKNPGKLEKCPYCESIMDSKGICTMCGSLSSQFQQVMQGQEICGNCGSSANAKGICSYCSSQTYPQRIASKEICSYCKSIKGSSGYCAYCNLQSYQVQSEIRDSGTGRQSFEDSNYYNNQKSGTAKLYSPGKYCSQANSMKSCALCNKIGNLSAQPNNGLLDKCANCLSDLDSQGVCLNCGQRYVAGVRSNMCDGCQSAVDTNGFFTGPDIFGRIMQAYKACSCKVCECFTSKNAVPMQPNTPCQCKPCQCPECARMEIQRMGCVFTAFPCFIQQNDECCSCKPCDCQTCAKTSKATTVCKCEPCRCANCTKLQKFAHRHIQEPKEACACSPCNCESCRMNPVIPIQASRHEVSVDTDATVFRHSDCVCENCVTETCQTLSKGSCLCVGKNKVMVKPIGKINTEFDIRTATVQDRFLNKKKAEVQTARTPIKNDFHLIKHKSSRSNCKFCKTDEDEKFMKPSKDNVTLHSSRIESHSSDLEYTEFKKTICKAQEQFSRNNSSIVSIANLLTPSQFSEDCSLPEIKTESHDIPNHGYIEIKSLNNCNHFCNVNNTNVTMYAKTYSQPLGNLHVVSKPSEANSSASALTHTSSYSNDVPTKDQSDSFEFGCVKEIRARTKCHLTSVPGAKVMEENNASTMKGNRQNAPSFFLPKLESQNNCILSHISSTATDISHSGTSYIKLKENKSTQDNFRKLKKFEKQSKQHYKVTETIVSDSETNTSSENLPLTCHTIDLKIKESSNNTLLENFASNLPRMANKPGANVHKVVENYRMCPPVEDLFSHSLSLPESFLNNNKPFSKWVKENHLVLQRKETDFACNSSFNKPNENYVLSHWSDDYKQAQIMFNSVETFSRQLLNLLEVFEAINDEFQNVSSKINIFRGRICSDLCRIRETIKNNDIFKIDNVTCSFPIHNGLTSNNISFIETKDRQTSSQEDIKLKHVSFENKNQVIASTLTNEYEKQNGKTTTIIENVPFFDDTYDKFVVYNVAAKTIDVIDVKNHVTLGEVPLQNEESEICKSEDSSSMIELNNIIDNLSLSINRRKELCSELFDNVTQSVSDFVLHKQSDTNIETEALKAEVIQDPAELSNDKADELNYNDVTEISENWLSQANCNEALNNINNYSKNILFNRQMNAIEFTCSKIEEVNSSVSQSESRQDALGEKFSQPQINRTFDSALNCEDKKYSTSHKFLPRTEDELLTAESPFVIPGAIDNFIPTANEKHIALRNENHNYAQTIPRQIMLKDAELSCTHQNTFETFDHKSRFRSLNFNDSIMGTQNRLTTKNLVQNGFMGKTSCDFLKVSDLGVRKISNDSVVVKWEKPMAYKEVCGYELLVDGKAVNKTLGPNACMAVVKCPSSEKVLITVKTMPKYCGLDHHPSATVVYCRRVNYFVK